MEKLDYKRVIVDVTMYAFPIFRVKICKNIKKSEAMEAYFSDWAKTIVEKCKHEDLENNPNRYYEILVAYCDARIKEQLELKEKLMNEPKKVAKLVTFEYTTRVIVNKNEMPEVEDEDAVNVAIEKAKSQIPTDLCFDHFVSIMDDEECPYGTFDDESEKKANEDYVIEALESLSKNEAFSECLKWSIFELRGEYYNRNNKEDRICYVIFSNIQDAIMFAKEGKELGHIVYFYVDGAEGCLNILDLE